MPSARRIELLGSPVFVLAVAALVLNDFVLKAAFHNWLTGKLSDFAGLTAVTIFANAIWPARSQGIALSVCLGFVYWKSSWSQPLIDFMNAVSPVRFGRTVDYTDLIALPAVGVVSVSVARMRTWPVRRWLLNAFAALSVLAFAATSSIGPTIRESADIPVSRDAAAFGRLEDDLQALLDNVAARHGLRCEVCDPLSIGRIYVLPAAPGARTSPLVLATSLDSKNSRLLYDIRASDSGKYPQLAYALHGDVADSLSSAYPGLIVAKTAYPKEINTQRIYVRKKGIFYRQSAFEADYVKAAAIVGQTASGRDLKRANLGVAGMHSAYYAGRLLDTYPEARELSVTVTGMGDQDIWIEVRCYSPAYVELQRAIADDLASRLRAEFGAERVR